MESTISLKQLSIADGNNIYEMLQRIPAFENSFTNPVNGKDYEFYKRWLIEQNDWACGKNLPKGYVPQVVYWFIVNGKVVGMGKIRHKLTKQSRINGGNIGYAIDPQERGKGYGKLLFNILLYKMKELKIGEIIATVDIDNIVSRKIVEECGGILFDNNNERLFFKFN